jgi:hypothetical protein
LSMEFVRDPALHCTRLQLEAQLRDLGAPDEVVSAIWDRMQKHQITNRLIPAGTARAQKAQAAAVQAKEEHVFAFHKELQGFLVTHGGTYGERPQMGPSELALMAELAADVRDLAARFELEYLSACKEYIRIGYEMMGGHRSRFSLAKYRYQRERIWNTFEAFNECSNDPTPEATQAFVAAYAQAVKNYKGMEDFQLVGLDKQLLMLHGRQAADKCEAEYAVWIEAQFDFWQMLDSIPEVSQLSGDEAANRYQKFLATHPSARKRPEGGNTTLSEYQRLMGLK